MFAELMELDLLLGDVRSLKQKRSAIRPLVSELRKKWAIAVAETGNHDLHRRCEVGVAVVSSDPTHCEQLLDEVERFVAARPEFELLSTRRRVVGPHD